MSSVHPVTQQIARAPSPMGYCVGVGAALLTAGALVALWYGAMTAPDASVREICVGSAAAPDWYLAEHGVAGKAYYTLRSGRGDTPWDARFGARPGGWLLMLRGESGCEQDSLLLQRADGSVWRVNLLTGAVDEAPVPSLPMIPMKQLFADEEE